MPVAVVPEGLDGLRADLGAARMFGVTRTRVEAAAEREDLRLDGVPIGKSARLRAGGLLEVNLEEPPAVSFRPELVAGLTVVYDDADILVVDKPAGIAAHPGLGWGGGSVVEHLTAAGYQLATLGPADRPGVVSRLDVGTSGLMVLAKSDLGYVSLQTAFRERAVTKIYHALVQGYPDPDEGTIESPIGHARTDEWKMTVTPSGRPAVTHYRLIRRAFRTSLLEVRLETGRTHQIRVHMAAIRHPCVGDRLYGADPRLAAETGLDRQWLHAAELGFAHPRTGEPMTFTSAYPEDLAHALAVVTAL